MVDYFWSFTKLQLSSESIQHQTFHLVFAMADRAMRLGKQLQEGFFLTAAVDHKRAAGVKTASRRRIQGAGVIPLQHDAMTPPAGIRNGNAGQQGMRVRVAGPNEKLRGGGMSCWSKMGVAHYRTQPACLNS
jgi:hypothetical protein